MYYLSLNVTQIMQEIYTYGPVETGFTVYEDFVSYQSGESNTDKPEIESVEDIQSD